MAIHREKEGCFFQFILMIIPIDIIVYTKGEFERFISLESSFADRIISEGKSII